MKQIIDEILEEEKAARQRIQQVRDEAKTIRMKADDEARRIVETTRESVKQDMVKNLKQAEEQAQAERNDLLAEAAQQTQSLWDEKRSEIEQTLNDLYRLVVGDEEL